MLKYVDKPIKLSKSAKFIWSVWSKEKRMRARNIIQVTNTPNTTALNKPQIASMTLCINKQNANLQLVSYTRESKILLEHFVVNPNCCRDLWRQVLFVCLWFRVFFVLKSSFVIHSADNCFEIFIECIHVKD